MAIFAINTFKTDYLGNMIFLIYFLIVLNFRLFNYLIMGASKSFGCDVCGKFFKEKNHLTNHIRIHTGEKPFACDICEKYFTRKDGLTKHIRVHTGVKPYCCNICEMTFSQSIHIATHTRIHTGEKPYECDICKKTFTRSSSLAEHTRIHKSETLYSCEVCKKSFSSTSYLVKHNKTATHLNTKKFRENKKKSVNKDSTSNLDNYFECGESFKVESIKEEISEDESVDDPLSISQIADNSDVSKPEIKEGEDCLSIHLFKNDIKEEVKEEKS